MEFGFGELTLRVLQDGRDVHVNTERKGRQVKENLEVVADVHILVQPGQ